MSRAIAMAYRILARAGVRTLPIDPLALLRRCRDTSVCTYLEAAEGLHLSESAFLRLCGDADAFTLAQRENGRTRYIVAYRTGGNPARLRFTLAHELGHRALGHTGSTPAEEREADLFASHLLCPRPVIARLAQRFLPLYAEQVAAICYVSLPCARAVTSAQPTIDATLLSEIDALFAEAADHAEANVAQDRLQHPLPKGE